MLAHLAAYFNANRTNLQNSVQLEKWMAYRNISSQLTALTRPWVHTRSINSKHLVHVTSTLIGYVPKFGIKIWNQTNHSLQLMMGPGRLRNCSPNWFTEPDAHTMVNRMCLTGAQRWLPLEHYSWACHLINANRTNLQNSVNWKWMADSNISSQLTALTRVLHIFERTLQKYRWKCSFQAPFELVSTVLDPDPNLRTRIGTSQSPNTRPQILGYLHKAHK